MLKFNESISRLRITEIPLKGYKSTCSHKQMNHLLERLDWFVSSNAWTTHFPNTLALSLSRDTSDHTPCVIIASTNILKPQVFRFENCRLEHDSFNTVMQQGWLDINMHPDKARNITAKLKNLRKIMKITAPKLGRHNPKHKRYNPPTGYHGRS
jgi:hypothetical protein